MSLIIEDGSIVEGANSYVTLEEARAYALQRGVVLPTVSPDLFKAVEDAITSVENATEDVENAEPEELEEAEAALVEAEANLVEARAALADGEISANSALEALLISAMDYLEGKRNEYQGSRTEPSRQELQFPRYGVKIDCVGIGSNFIPKELKNAQIVLAMELFSGINLQPTRSDGFVTEEKTGPLTTKYSEKVSVSISPKMTAVDDLLNPLFNACGHKFTLSALRV